MISFFSKQEEERLIDAIQDAEKNTSGEIRVHLESKCKGAIIKEAAKTFRRLKMHKTKARNGVLIFIAPERKEFAILGDTGINEVVPENFWADVRDLLQQYFREGAFTEGIRQSILLVGEKLKVHFPYQSDDENELSDDISYG